MKTDMSALYATALILNPGHHMRYIEVNWPKKWVKPTLERVKKLWQSYQEAASVPTTLASPLYCRPFQEPKELDTFDQITRSLKQVAWPASQDEYEDYNSGEPYELGTGASALTWWCHDTQRQHWPQLSCMAIDILSIPAMSDELERVFSGACHMISWERGQLDPETVEMTECLKHWKKSGILDKFLE